MVSVSVRVVKIFWMVFEIRIIHGFSLWYGMVRLMSADELRDWLSVFLIFRKGAHWNLFHFCIFFSLSCGNNGTVFQLFRTSKIGMVCEAYTNTCTFSYILSYSFSHLLLSPLAILIINTAVYMLFIPKNVCEKKILFTHYAYTRVLSKHWTKKRGTRFGLMQTQFEWYEEIWFHSRIQTAGYTREKTVFNFFFRWPPYNII